MVPSKNKQQKATVKKNFFKTKLPAKGHYMRLFQMFCRNKMATIHHKNQFLSILSINEISSSPEPAEGFGWELASRMLPRTIQT